MQIVDKNTRKPFKHLDHKMAVICGVGGYTCWSRIRLTARGKTIKDYPYATYMAHVPMVVGIDAGYMNSVLASTAAFSIDTDPVHDESFVANAGLNDRRILMQRSKILECIARPFLPPFMNDSFIPALCNWTIECTLNSSDFCIIYEPDTVDPPEPKPGKPKPLKLVDAELILLKAELEVNLVELTKEAKDTVYRQMTGSAKLQIPFIDYEVLNLSIPQSQAEFTTVTNITRYPRRLYAVFVAESDMLGVHDTTPLYYRNLNLRKFELSVNGQTQSVSTNFPNKTYIEGYQAMVRAMSIGNRALVLRRYDWAEAQTIFVFDLTAAHLAGCLDIVSVPSENASWNIHLEFADKLPFSVNMIVILEKEALLEIDSDYNVNVV